MAGTITILLITAGSLLSQGTGSYMNGSRDSWNNDTIDTGILQTDPTIRIDTQGYPHVAYVRTDASTTVRSIEYAHFDGFCWRYSTIESYDDFKYCFLALNGNDPLIVYQTGAHPYTLSLATPDGGGGWQIEDFLTDTDWGTLYDLETDSYGNPHVIYYNGNAMAEKDLHHIYHNGSYWENEIVWWFGDGALCTAVSLALSSSDVPHLAQYNIWTGWEGNQDPYIRLYHTTYTGSSWTGTNLGDSDGDDTDIALDGSGLPRIVYQSNTDLRIQSYNGSTWEMAQIDPARQARYYCALAVDAAGVNHVAYHDSQNNDLRYAWGAGSSWNTMTVDSVGVVGTQPEIALDGNGNPFIVYSEETIGQIKLAWYGDSTGTGGQGPESPGILTITGVSPNPADRSISLTVATASGMPVELYFFDVAGRLVRECLPEAREGRYTLFEEDVSDLPPGVYSVLACDGENRDITRLTIMR
ncbi:MAG: T9SS type A sorting domain-containing protein [Candidatus Fermentibacteraceae bacterium]|nr:T9SS type A sorting domain-containing protein [Candidatus Fermentibacteraceae bacterium]